MNAQSPKVYHVSAGAILDTDGRAVNEPEPLFRALCQFARQSEAWPDPDGAKWCARRATELLRGIARIKGLSAAQVLARAVEAGA